MIAFLQLFIIVLITYSSSMKAMENGCETTTPENGVSKPEIVVQSDSDETIQNFEKFIKVHEKIESEHKLSQETVIKIRKNKILLENAIKNFKEDEEHISLYSNLPTYMKSTFLFLEDLKQIAEAESIGKEYFDQLHQCIGELAVINFRVKSVRKAMKEKNGFDFSTISN
jgi:hypothetical protein